MESPRIKQTIVLPFSQSDRLRIMQQRAHSLFRRAGNLMRQDGVLSEAFEELVSALEALQAGERERRTQFENWLNERAALEAEVQRYRDLFVQAPIAYLVTSVDGTIRMANTVAAQLLGSTEKGLVGRSLSLFLLGGQRRLFRNELTHVAQSGVMHEWALPMQSLQETTFQAVMQATPNRSQDGRTLALWWIIRPVNS